MPSFWHLSDGMRVWTELDIDDAGKVLSKGLKRNLSLRLYDEGKELVINPYQVVYIEPYNANDPPEAGRKRSGA